MADKPDKPKKKPFFNVSRAMGLGFLSSFNKTIAHNARLLFKPKKSDRQETFEEAKIRLNLSEEDIQKRARDCAKFALGFAIFAFLTLFYMIYLFWHAHIAAGLLAFVITVMVLTQAFRYHFWYFQMKSRKLGCTFKEWLESSWKSF